MKTLPESGDRPEPGRSRQTPPPPPVAGQERDRRCRGLACGLRLAVYVRERQLEDAGRPTVGARERRERPGIPLRPAAATSLMASLALPERLRDL